MQDTEARSNEARSSGRLVSLDHGAHSSAEQLAERNRLLRAFSPADYAWISTHLERVPLKQNDVLAEPNEPFQHVHFVETAVVSVVNSVSGGTVEVGTVGNEGIAGLSAFLDAGESPSKTFVQIAGEGKRIDARIFVEGVDERRQMRRMLNRYTQAFLAQVSQTAACNRMHDIQERCARWLLMTHDRIGGVDSFTLTHEFLSFMLGVRRAGVTVAAGTLQKAGLIRYVRGRVTVLDRAGLEAASCDCYGIVKGHFDRLLGANAGVPQPR
jgi:CRP-like cAMP-binding protein